MFVRASQRALHNCCQTVMSRETLSKMSETSSRTYVRSGVFTHFSSSDRLSLHCAEVFRIQCR
jgi:hypothetical protein